MRSMFNIKHWFEERAKAKAKEADLRDEIILKLNGLRDAKGMDAAIQEAAEKIVFGKNARKRKIRRGISVINDKSPTAFENGSGFIAKLKKHGFVKLGSGAHATVLAKEGSKRVIKVLRNPFDGWIEYIRWAEKMGFAGTFAPKVYSYKYINKGRFAIASMERLKETVSDIDGTHPMAPVYGLMTFAANHDNDNAKKILDFAVPGMSTFTSQLRLKFSENYDLHRGNFMLREDGTLVAVDPVAGLHNTDCTKRFKARVVPLAA